VRATANVWIEGSKATFSGDGSCAIRYDRVLSGFIGLKARARARTMPAVQANEPGWNRIGAAILRHGEQSFEFPLYSSFSVLNPQATHRDGQPYFMHLVFGALAHAGPRAKLTRSSRRTAEA